MARTVNEIQSIMLTTIAENEILSSLTSTSATAFFRLVTYIVAYAISTLEKIFDQHTQEVENIIKEKVPGTPRWYRNMVLNFQYGFDLIVDTDKFDNTGATSEQIELSKIIKYAAVTETNSGLIIKVATEINGVLSPITESQKTSLEAYIKEINYAGVKFFVVNYPPDILLVWLQIYRDALVLDENGMNIKTGIKTVEVAMNDYMKELPFNGELVIDHLIDKIQAVAGVRYTNLINSETQSFDIISDGYELPQPLNVKTIPVSGYFKIETFNNVSYVV